MPNKCLINALLCLIIIPEFCTDHVEKAGLATSGSLFSRNFGRIELSLNVAMETYPVDQQPVFLR